MRNNERETYNVYSLQLAKYLLNIKHFPLIATKQLKEDTSRTMFMFEKTPEIEKVVDDWNNGRLI